MNNSYNKLTELYVNNIIHYTPENKNKTGILDTGATGHYLQVDASHHPSTNIGPPIHLGLPNGKTVQSINPCLLDFPFLPKEACERYIILSLAHSQFVSIGKLCDAGCTDEFKSQEVTIKHKGGGGNHPGIKREKQ